MNSSKTRPLRRSRTGSGIGWLNSVLLSRLFQADENA
jgi:hypothetical protein